MPTATTIFHIYGASRSFSASAELLIESYKSQESPISTFLTTCIWRLCDSVRISLRSLTAEN